LKRCQETATKHKIFLTSTNQVQNVVWAALQNVDIVGGINAAVSGSVVEFIREPVWISSATIGGRHWSGGGGSWVGGDNSWGASGGSVWSTGGTNHGGGGSAGGTVETVPAGESHVQRVFRKKVDNVSDENGVDVASLNGTVVAGVGGGALAGVVGVDIEWVLDVGDHVNILVLFAASEEWRVCGVVVVKTIVVLVPLFTSFVNSVLGGTFVRFVHVEPAPATVVCHG